MGAQSRSRPLKRSQTLAEELTAEISQRIRDGDIQAGDRLPTESALMEERGVSRTVVREAISRLQAAGLVETRHGIGTFALNAANDVKFRLDPATIITLPDVIDVLELRLGLEVEAARLAARRRTTGQLATLEQALQNLKNVQKLGGDGIAEDIQYHLMIAQATGNRYFAETLGHLGATMIPRTRVNTARLSKSSQSKYLAKLNREHEDIFAAIARQDAEAASAAMRIHLTNSRERLRSIQSNIEAHSG